MSGDLPTTNAENLPDIDLTKKTKSKDPLMGTVLDGRFEIEDVLGQGGMSVVYKAKQLRVNRLVAIKTIRMQLDTKPVYRERFQREISSLFSLSHPNIVTVHDFLIGPDEQPYVVMDYLRGKPLDELIKNEGPLAIERFARISVQICSALDHAHKRGIIHRDLKPSNVVLLDNENDFVKVVDFGLAKLNEDNRKLTQSGELWGSPPYMSPEQCLGGGGDARSDVYSLGACMYEMLCGKDPFWYAATIFELIQRHVNTIPAPLHENCEGLTVPNEIESVVFKALEKNPEDRYQSAQEMQEAIINACTIASGSENLRFHASVSPRISAERSMPTVDNPQGEDPTKSQQASWFAGMLMAADDPLNDPAKAKEFQQLQEQNYQEDSRWARPDPSVPSQTGVRGSTQAQISGPTPAADRQKTAGAPSGQTQQGSSGQTQQGWSPEELDKIKSSSVQPAPPVAADRGDSAYLPGAQQSRMSSTIEGAPAYPGGNVGALRSRMPYDNDQMRQWMPVIAVICIAVGFACAFAIFNSMQKKSNSATTVQTTPAPSTTETSGTASNTSDSDDNSDKEDSSNKSSTPVKRTSSSQDDQPKPTRRVSRPAKSTPKKARPVAPKPKPKKVDPWDRGNFQ